LKSGFGWTPAGADLAGVHPEKFYCVFKKNSKGSYIKEFPIAIFSKFCYVELQTFRILNPRALFDFYNGKILFKASNLR
jgi:hypothetical protein